MNIQDRPPHEKKRIALGITIAVGVILIAVLILYYHSQSGKKEEISDSPLSRFYTTIQSGAQSLFTPK